MTDRRDVSQSVSTGVAAAVAGQLEDGDLELIRSMGDGSAEPEDIYPFRMIASGDGLDFYFTRQADSSMRNYVRDLKAGQSVLGSHDINTYSLGQSYDAEIIDADPTARYYEAAFYRQYADKPDLATKRVVVGKYFLTRGVELSGQKTDDLIKSMRMGNVRKASISFTVGRYVCSIDGIDLLNSWFGPWPDEEEGCAHFPGVEYKTDKGDKVLAHAVMEDNDLLETSLVYKNASPSAMLIRKAEDLARQGRLPTKELARLEERLQVRLPQHDKAAFPGVSLEGQNRMGGQDRKTDDPKDPAADAGLGGDVEPKGDPDPAPDPAPSPDSDAGDSDDVTPEVSEAAKAAQTRLAQVDTRDAEITTLIGGPVTVEAIRSLKADADLGTELYKHLVDEAVEARTRVQSETFDLEGYRKVLTNARDVNYVTKEIESWGGAARKVFIPGRQVDPPPASDPGDTDRLPSEREDAPTGLLAGVINTQSKRS